MDGLPRVTVISRPFRGGSSSRNGEFREVVQSLAHEIVSSSTAAEKKRNDENQSSNTNIANETQVKVSQKRMRENSSAIKNEENEHLVR